MNRRGKFGRYSGLTTTLNNVKNHAIIDKIFFSKATKPIKTNVTFDLLIKYSRNRTVKNPIIDVIYTCYFFLFFFFFHTYIIYLFFILSQFSFLCLSRHVSFSLVLIFWLSTNFVSAFDSNVRTRKRRRCIALFTFLYGDSCYLLLSAVYHIWNYNFRLP